MNKEVQDKITEMIITESMNDIKNTVNATLDDFKTAMEAKIEGVKTAAYADIKSLESYVTTEKPLVVNLGTVEAPKNELVHKSFATITKILSSTKRKEKNIMLVGGAGGGKTHLVGSVARALKLNFYPMSVGLQTTKSDLLGFINANGIYMPSPIRLAYENGGVLLLDEFDSAHAGVITILNSLLANGHCSFPDKIVEKHKDFVCLCACNTYGKGGTIDYVGRNRLDAATLDRFIIVDVDYDENLERELTKNDEWTNTIKQIRDTIDKFGIKMIVSPRASMDGADLLEAGFTMDEVLQMCIFKGCDDDVKTKILKNITVKKSSSSRRSSRRPKWLSDDVTLDIRVDFNTKEYLIVADMEHRKEFHLRISDRYEIAVEDWYNPFLCDNYLYLNSDKHNLYEDDEKQTERQIQRFMNDLKNIQDKSINSARISVQYVNTRLTVNLQNGKYYEEEMVEID